MISDDDGGEDDAGSNHPRGVPDPDKIGFFGSVWGEPESEEQTAAIATVARHLGRPVQSTDAEGYEHEIVGGCSGDGGARLAWIEGRSKWIGDVMDVEFVLHATIGGREVITWPVETYNPFFDCAVGWMDWMGDFVVAIYREKHRTLVAALRAETTPRLIEIDDDWTVAGDTVYYRSTEEGLAEGLSLPELTRLTPLAASAASRMTAPLRVPPATDARRFHAALRDLLFGSNAAQPETDLVIGALTHRFWDRWPEVSSSYPHGIGHPWNSPCWLPFYWHVLTQPRPGASMVSVLDALAAHSTADFPSDALTAAAGYVSERSRVLASACRAGRLPEDTECFFWIDWSLKDFEGDIDRFPDGFRRALEQLKPHRARWEKLAKSA